MKKLLTLTAIALLGLAVFSGCKKKDSSPSYTMKATVGGTAFSVTNAYATLLAGTLTITGNSGSSTTYSPPYLTMDITNYTNLGTYTIDTTLAGNVIASYAVDLTGTNDKIAKTGSVTITSITTTNVVGTFNFVCTDGTTITSGTFNAKRY